MTLRQGSSFKRLASLNVLDISGNREITSLQPLTTLHRLEELTLTNAMVTGYYSIA